MGLSRTVSVVKGDFTRKWQIFPTSRVFNAPAEEVPLAVGYRCLGTKKTRMVGLPGTNVMEDRQTDSGRQLR